MTNNQHVWAVSTGDYDDYRIETVCDTEERAQAVADAINAKSPCPFGIAEVEKWQVFTGEIEDVEVLSLTVQVTKGGDTIHERESVDSRPSYEATGFYWEVSFNDRTNTWWVTVIGTDHTQAREQYDTIVRGLAPGGELREVKHITSE